MATAAKKTTPKAAPAAKTPAGAADKLQQIAHEAKHGDVRAAVAALAQHLAEQAGE